VTTSTVGLGSGFVAALALGALRLDLGPQALGALDADALAGLRVGGVPAAGAVGAVDADRHDPVADLGGVDAADLAFRSASRLSPFVGVGSTDALL
jgi:hypothetical protein